MTKKEMQDRVDFVASKLREYGEMMVRENVPYGKALLGLAKVLTEE